MTAPSLRWDARVDMPVLHTVFGVVIFFFKQGSKRKEFQVATYVEEQNLLFIKVSGQGEIIPQVKQYSANCFQNPIFFLIIFF